MSPVVPVLARAVVTLPSGQTRFAFPSVPRARYQTGQQDPCVDCAAMDLVRLGVSRDGPGSDPLCLACWGRRQRRSQPRFTPEEAGWLAELEEELACEECRPQRARPVADLPVEAVESRRRWRRRERARERSRPSRRKPARKRSGCWRCGDADWVAAARVAHVADQAQAEVEAQRVEELEAALATALKRMARAERRLGYVQDWQARVEAVVEAMPPLVKTGSKGRTRPKRGPAARARAVWLIADFLARMAAERAERGVAGRGRRPQYDLVVGVMAIAADPAAGRRSMAGLEHTARYAGVVTKTVTTAWAYSTQVGATLRVEEGRTCSLQELAETGLRRRRAVYDFAELHRSPFDATPFVGQAAAVVARLLERAVQLVDEHQAVLDEARRGAAAAEAALLGAKAAVAERATADLLLQAEFAAPLDAGRQPLQAAAAAAWAAQTNTAFQASNAARDRATAALSPRIDPLARTAERRAVLAAQDAATAVVHRAFDQASRMAGFYDPPRSGLDKKSSSGLKGLLFSPPFTTSPDQPRRPVGRGEEQRRGASRPAPTRGAGHARSERPRTPNEGSRTSRNHTRRSTVMAWAKPLAKGLVQHMPFLAAYVADADDGRQSTTEMAREHGRRLAMIATTIGPRLSAAWCGHPDDVVRLLEQHAGIHSLIAPGASHTPLAYLARLLDRALTNPDAIVPWPSPVHAAAVAAAAAQATAATQAHSAQLRAEHDARQQTVAADRARRGGRPPAGLLAARQVAAGAHRATGPAWTEPIRQPGTGLPLDWDRHRDR